MKPSRLRRNLFASESGGTAIIVSVLVLLLLAGFAGGLATRAATGKRKPARSADERGELLELPEPKPRRTAPSASAPAPSIRAPEPASFDTARAMSHVSYLSETIGDREQGTPGEEAAARYVREQLSSYGYSPTTQSVPIPVTGRTTQNVIASLTGTQRPGRTVVVGAHLDTKGGPGANDNATGVGVTLELARVLKNNARQVPAVEFVFFGGEEIPAGGSADQHHWGSQYFLDSLPATEKARLGGMLSVDMVGAGDNFYANNMGLAPQTLLDMVLAVGSRSGMTYRKDPGWSDHEPFEKAGIPTVWLEYTGGNPYHEPGDDYASVNPAHVGTAGAVLQELFESYLTAERTDQL